jgi:uncharacterized repeat protein (TIGR01451 family)
LRLAHFDLISALFIPFVLATGLVVVATSNTLHKRGVIESGNAGGDRAVVVKVGTVAGESNLTVSFDAIISGDIARSVAQLSCQTAVTCEIEGDGEIPKRLEWKGAVATALGGAVSPERKGELEDTSPLVVGSIARLLTDRDKDGLPGAADTLRYEVKIENRGQKELTALVFKAKPDANTRLVPASVESRTITQNAIEAARVLAPVVGATFGRVIFGVGMLAIALSTITVHMLMCAFILSEMFHVQPTGWKYRLMVLTPAIGAFGVAWKLPFGVAVFASSVCVIFLPMAYVCFMVLHNKKRFMGETLPRGGKRAFWNVGMALAIAVVTLAAIVKLTILYGDIKKRHVKPKPGAELQTEHPTVASR